MIAEKQSLRAALAAAICAFGVSFGAVFCPVSAFGLPVDSWALLLVCLYLTLTTGGGLFLLPGVLWLTVNGVLPNGTKHDKISCYNK